MSSCTRRIWWSHSEKGLNLRVKRQRGLHGPAGGKHDERPDCLSQAQPLAIGALQTIDLGLMKRSIGARPARVHRLSLDVLDEGM